MKHDRRGFLKGFGSFGFLPLIGNEVILPVVNVKDHGAKGDGVTNDTAAFVAATAALNTAKQGTLLIPYGTYIVGVQIGPPGNAVSGYAYTYRDIVNLQNCTGRVLVKGQTDVSGKRPILRAATGMRFGAFDPVTGAPYASTHHFLDKNYQASVYEGMIKIKNCASAYISDLELDGNQSNLVLGGIWGDTGYQCQGSGIVSQLNGSVECVNVYSHHQALDGIHLSGSLGRPVEYRPHILRSCVFQYNARNNFSWTACSGIRAYNCDFSHAGMGSFESAPGSGIDIEPDNQIEDGLFENCTFQHNYVYGVVSDGNRNVLGNIKFESCRITAHIESIGGSMLVRNPMTFSNCTIIGSMGAGLSSLPISSVVFTNCSIADVQAKDWGSGYLMVGSNASTALVSCSITAHRQVCGNLNNARLSNCRFICARPLTQPPPHENNAYDMEFINVRNAIVDNCIFEDAIPAGGDPKKKLFISNLGATYTNNTITPGPFPASRLYTNSS
ncbi:MAG TPA: right-handed parallel beta-helix repeat-containing protein [Methylobacter sp.]|jgi:hypothetical protein